MADVLTSAELGKRRVPTFELRPPYEFLGRLVAGFFLLVYGRKGSGKSTWTLGLARALVELAPLVYVSGEEDHGPAFADRIRRMDAGHPDFHIALWTADEAAGVLDVVDRTRARFVVLDSATRIDPTSRKVQELWDGLKARGVALVAIGHADKNGQAKVGGTFLEHEVHTVVRVEKVKPDEDPAVAVAEKNRYAGLASWAVPFSADDVDEYGFVAYDRDGRTWFKNGDMTADQRAAMFARLEESGERTSPKNGRRSSRSGGGSASSSAASRPKRTRNPGATPAPADRMRQAQRAVDNVREAVEAGTYNEGRDRLDVVGTYRDGEGRSVLVLRGEGGDLNVGTMGRLGLNWRKGQPESALDALTPAELDVAFPANPEAEKETPAPKPKPARSKKTAAKKGPKRAPKKTPAKEKTASAPKPAAPSPEAARLDGAEETLTGIRALLEASLRQN